MVPTANSMRGSERLLHIPLPLIVSGAFKDADKFDQRLPRVLRFRDGGEADHLPALAAELVEGVLRQRVLSGEDPVFPLHRAPLLLDCPRPWALSRAYVRP